MTTTYPHLNPDEPWITIIVAADGGLSVKIGVSCLVWTWIERDFCYVWHDEETRTRTVRV
jgi:hypothetical protein